MRHFYDDFGWLHGLSTLEAADQIVGDLGERGFLVDAGTYLHDYAHCWRCDTPIIYRLSDDWFISVDGVRPRLLEENAKVEWVPEYMGKRMDDSAAQHGRLEHLAPPLLRPAAAVLPRLRLRPPDRDRVEGRARGACARGAFDQLQSCAGRGSIAVP